MAESETTVPSARTLSAVTFAAGFGGFIEYFDLFIATFAGIIVWPKLFFAGVPPNYAIAYSLASVGITFLVRPFGGFIFGHIGDKTGRRNTLVVTLAILGISVFGIGLLPDYLAIGITAPILLFLFRALFGLGLGGEYGGAVSWILEFAGARKSKRRSFWAVWAAPANIGLTVAGVVFGIAAASPSFLFSYGWRIPFIVGGLMIVVAFIVRMKLEESPLFKSVAERGAVDRTPAIDMLKKHWKTVAALAIITGAIQGGVTTSIVTPFSIGYLAIKGVSPSFASYGISLANALGIITFLAGPYFTEKLGRRRHLFISILWCLFSVIVFFPLLNTLNPMLILLAYILVEVQVGFNNSAIQTILGESFPTKYRYSGSGFTYQLGNGFIVGTIVSFLLPALVIGVGGTLSAAPYLAAVTAVWILIALASLTVVKETKGIDLAREA